MISHHRKFAGLKLEENEQEDYERKKIEKCKG